MAKSASPSSMAKMIIPMLVVALTISSMPMQSSAAISCGLVVIKLVPCIGYVQNGGNNVPYACCNGITSLYNAAVTTPDRQTVCNCIVSASRGFKYDNYNLRRAASLPARCGVHLPYQIDPSIDCSKVT
ncbi:Non-specific lipid-transfer protein Lac s 1 [Linum grandiflorum]